MAAAKIVRVPRAFLPNNLDPGVMIASFSNGRLVDGDNMKLSLFASEPKNTSKSVTFQAIAESARMAYRSGRSHSDITEHYENHDVEFSESESDDEDESHVELPVKTLEDDIDNYSDDENGVLSDTNDQPARYLVGVRDKTTNEMKLYPSTMFKFRPCMPGATKPKKRKHDKTPTSFREKSDNLTGAFGSAKKLKAMTSRLDNAIVTGDLEHKIGNAAVMALENLGEQSAPEISESSSLIPPYNKEALTLPEAYPLQNIISDEDMLSLKPKVLSIAAMTYDERKTYASEQSFCTYVYEQFMHLPSDEERKIHRLNVLVYLQSLVTLYNTQVKKLRLKNYNPVPLVSDEVRARIMSQFTLKSSGTNKSRPVICIPKRLKDKLISYILVLCLIVDDFKTSVINIRNDLNMSVQRVRSFASALGCKQSGDDAIELTLPLTFPAPLTKSKKDRR